ncbi:MAG TPA: oxalate:formate antiporter, partial [Candidatus Methylomirabilis sp.]|nr:oxalate:formate antiporter [Candidatus Methylomirabilis sp.]
KNLGVNYGGLFTAYGVAGLVLSLFAIQVRVATGAWTTAFWYLTIASVVGLALTFITRAPAPKEAEAKA